MILFLVGLFFVIWFVGYDLEILCFGWLVGILGIFVIVLNFGGMCIFFGGCFWLWVLNEFRSLDMFCLGGGVGFCLWVLFIEEFIVFIELRLEVFLFKVFFGFIMFFGRCIFIVLLGVVYVVEF